MESGNPLVQCFMLQLKMQKVSVKTNLDKTTLYRSYFYGIGLQLVIVSTMI